jgi:hypothetical protein
MVTDLLISGQIRAPGVLGKKYSLRPLFLVPFPLAGCAHFFDEGDIGVYQVRAGHVRRPLPTSLRRDDLYRE